MQTLALIARHPELDRNSFRDHYEKTHVPLALPLLGGLKRYVRNHVVASLLGDPPAFDVLTEFSYRDRDAFEGVLSRLSGSEGEVIAEDENRFMDKPRNVFFGVDKRAGEGVEDPQGAEKWALLLDRQSVSRMDAFEAFLRESFTGAHGWRLWGTHKIAAEPPLEAVAFVCFERGSVDVARLLESGSVLGLGDRVLRVDARVSVVSPH